MAHHLIAVLVRATATVHTIDAHLTRPMRLLARHLPIDGYRLGGQVTGAWDPTYQPHADPSNWRACGTCGGTTRVGDVTCPDCADADAAGRRPGTVVPWDHTDWAPYAGDIVALPRLLHPGWRFPAGRTPVAWVDAAGVVWLDTDHAAPTGTDTGAVPPRLLQVFRDLLHERRDPGTVPARRTPSPAGWAVHQRRYPGRSWRPRNRFNPNAWSVAVVDAHS
ncbi:MULTISPECIES: hypothetical protein [unclassified Micromonospora]|uniref:hypothetical protein n=1 Tax=unclassified Micromonospora TaxID=2617518 RepID=UPI001C22CFA6|nr:MULTISPECIES: hypothetical protein [unclassified Micromonospora]MBU8857759.1 hypothetical protein [Micromonospora sp. WMMB482]MDM4783386.1 hypothetical protein [Micromonospora sp. b486]